MLHREYNDGRDTVLQAEGIGLQEVTFIIYLFNWVPVMKYGMFTRAHH